MRDIIKCTSEPARIDGGVDEPDSPPAARQTRVVDQGDDGCEGGRGGRCTEDKFEFAVDWARRAN